MLTCDLSSVHNQSLTTSPLSVITLWISKRANPVDATVLVSKVCGVLHDGSGNCSNGMLIS